VAAAAVACACCEIAAPVGTGVAAVPSLAAAVAIDGRNPSAAAMGGAAGGSPAAPDGALTGEAATSGKTAPWVVVAGPLVPSALASARPLSGVAVPLAEAAAAGSDGCVVAGGALGVAWPGIAVGSTRAASATTIEAVASGEPPRLSRARVPLPRDGVAGFAATGLVGSGVGSADGTEAVSSGRAVALCVVPLTGVAGDDVGPGVVCADGGAASWVTSAAADLAAADLAAPAAARAMPPASAGANVCPEAAGEAVGAARATAAPTASALSTPVSWAAGGSSDGAGAGRPATLLLP
jgi:hypothetical protein